MNPKSDDERSGSEVVGGCEDLLTEILSRLHPKSLIRLKSVSKPWLHLISTSTQVRHRSSRLCKEISGLLAMRKFIDSENDFIPLCENAGAGSRRNSPMKTLDFVEGKKLEVLDHCNAFLLCSSRHVDGCNRHDYYVFNPTTKEYSTVSVDRAFMFGETEAELWENVANLAFDPRKSLHYKLLIFYRSDYKVHLRVYSSDTGVMTQFDTPYGRLRVGDNHVPFLWGAYWNGAVNWFDYGGGSYINVDEERFGRIPTVPFPKEKAPGGCHLEYHGGSNDHLHVIMNYSKFRYQFEVYEMDRGYSGWFLRFRADLQSFFSSNPPEKLSVMGVFRKDDDDDKSFLVLSTPGMVFRHNFEDESTAIVCETGKQHLNWRIGSIPFIESLYHP